MEFEVDNITQLPEIAEKIIKMVDDNRIIIFVGEMGAGKTTLIKALCSALGVEENTSSPTFSIVNQYISNTQKTIYHFDFYRIRNEQEAYDMGYEEYFFSENYCFIEWPEKISNLLPDNAITVKIDVISPEKRRINIF